MAKGAISTKALYGKLDRLYEDCPSYALKDNRRWVIFSDLHMGDGGSTDDFRRNSDLFLAALRDYYQKREHSLVLNGDIEELQRFSVEKIRRKWHEVYNQFDHFHKENRLFKTIGNHDLELLLMKNLPFEYALLEGLKLNFEDNNLFIFHGHQASKKYQEHNELIGFTLKYFANPLGIKSYSVAHSSKKQYKIEKRVYGYSSFNKVVSVIGHTHRPLFESLHKVERLKYKIEQLCRDFAESTGGTSGDIKSSIKSYKKELRSHYRNNMDHSYQNYVYNTMFHIPCLFNSGCAIGKRGITCLEIEDEKIKLVHWFDKKISKKYLINSGYEPERLGKTDFYRMVINEESLHYIFARINLLS